MAFGIKKLLKKISPTEIAQEEITSQESKETSPKESKQKASKATAPKAAIKDEAKPQTIAEEASSTSSKSIKSKSTKKEENTMTEETQASGPGEVQHEYVEVAADLLAKPSALCDLVEAQGGKAVIIFCNNPSDTDFVEVILKKRGISAAKLIGFVAPEKLEKTQERVKKSDLAAVVVTDVAARGLDFNLFPVVVNYSLPIDAETYHLRAAIGKPGSRTAVSIVSPLDFANFHTIKTTTDFEFVKREAPTKEDLAKAKLTKVRTTAQAKGAAFDPALSELAKQVSKDSESNSIIAYLLQNLFEVIPQLQAQVDKLSWERENLEHEGDDVGQDQPPYRGNGGGGRDRDQRGARGGRDRQGGGRDRQDRDRPDSNRGPPRDRNDGGRGRGPRQDDEGQDQRDEGRRFNDRRDSDGDDNGGRRSREDRRPPPPQKIRDDRLYIGRGEKDGLSEDEFAGLLKEHCGIERDQLKRFLLRKNYAFADLPEGIGADVVTKLDGVASKAGNLYVTKATQVVTVIEQEQNQGEDANSESQSEEGFDGEDQPAA